MPPDSFAEVDHWGDRLIARAASTTTELVLVCPFIKVGVVDRIFVALDRHVDVHVVTRWRPDEIAQGVSDLEVWNRIRGRSGSRMWLHPMLHAKYYRFDDYAMLGSANLTSTGLGWARHSNVELLTETSPLPDFEERLREESAAASDAIAAHMQEAADALAPSMTPYIPEAEEHDGKGRAPWLPQTRHPEDLFLAHIGRHNELSRPTRESARVDLAALGVPLRLSEESFRRYVRAVLLSLPVVIEISEAAAGELKRFGEITQLIARRTGMDRDQAATSWQTLMRWLLYFASDVYERARPRHSELIRYRPDLA